MRFTPAFVQNFRRARERNTSPEDAGRPSEHWGGQPSGVPMYTRGYFIQRSMTKMARLRHEDQGRTQLGLCSKKHE